ncbi:MAG: glucose-6-phosphate dehydrogenase [Candidatus Magasanikbacteria bacterium]|nr:glucose-6-phosphate dehydrogenase [Candidatus Magasanikbacteria bacterium]
MSKSNITNISPSIFIIFGVTGDLAAKKIIPSLWHLFQHGRLPKQLAVVGFSRRELLNEEFKELVLESIKKHADAKAEDKDFADFFKLFSYQAGTFNDEEAFRSLSDHIARIENDWKVCANKLFYLAVPPSLYEQIFKSLASVKLNIPCGGDIGWSRILIEKPFGTDMASAQKLQSLLSAYFKEKQIYRIDHYLFKEIIQGIENFRFSNNLFENAWDNTMIERIDIRLLESIGVEDRGSFYDSVGALRDVGQNHMLTMLAAITMEYPARMDTDGIRENRANILKTLNQWTDEMLRKNTFRSQYSGYKDIKGVAPDSDTETYFSFKTELAHPRWQGIPIYMEAGKRMAEARKEIVLTLKHPSVCLLCEQGPHAPNRIVFRLEPNDEVIISFWTKKPGFEKAIEERIFSFFLYEKETKVQYVEEYAKILHATIEGDQTLFISSDEVVVSWKFADPIVEGWRRGIVPLAEYKPGTTPIPTFFEKSKNTRYAQNRTDTDEIGVVGLGKMGGNIARRLVSKKWKVVGYNVIKETTKKLEQEGIQGSYSFVDFVLKLSKPRTIWLMVPHDAVDKVINELTPLLNKGDTLIDGGNSPYKESIRRSKQLALKGIDFLDVGVSGGPGGALNGACLMVGGSAEIYQKYEHLFKDLSVSDGYGYMGKSGAGHFVKMIHNGIEYGMMQALAEGFSILKKAKYKLNLAEVAEVYNHGSVIESRLIVWLKNAFELHGGELKGVSGSVGYTGEGEWTVKAAKELKVKAKIIEEALKFRIHSAKSPSFIGRILSALREQFGGHSIKN